MTKDKLTPAQHARKWVSGDLIKVKGGTAIGNNEQGFEKFLESGGYARSYKTIVIPQDTILFFLGELKVQNVSTTWASTWGKFWWKSEIYWIRVDEKLRLIHTGKKVQNP